MNDAIAMLVGRIILVWGQLDQWIYNTATVLQVGHDRPIEEPDPRFNRRLRLVRRLISELTDADKAVLKDFDRLKRMIMKLDHRRGHFAHGGVVSNYGNGVVLRDYGAKPAEGAARADQAGTGRDNRLLTYSVEDLISLADDIECATTDWAKLQMRTRQRSRELKDRTPAGS